MRDKESKCKDGYPDMPIEHGKCALCGIQAMSHQRPIVCVKHRFEPADCKDCPGNDCQMCEDYGINVYRKFVHGGWRP